MTSVRVRPVAPPAFATLVWTIPVRILDISRCGCRLDSARWLAVGTAGRLRVSLGQRRRHDDVRIARCQPREGAGARYLLGAELLRTRRLERGSIRLAVEQLIGRQEGRALPVSRPSSDRSPASEAEGPSKEVGRAPPPCAATKP